MWRCRSKGSRRRSPGYAPRLAPGSKPEIPTESLPGPQTGTLCQDTFLIPTRGSLRISPRLRPGYSRISDHNTPSGFPRDTPERSPQASPPKICPRYSWTTERQTWGREESFITLRFLVCFGRRHPGQAEGHNHPPKDTPGTPPGDPQGATQGTPPGGSSQGTVWGMVGGRRLSAAAHQPSVGAVVYGESIGHVILSRVATSLERMRWNRLGLR